MPAGPACCRLPQAWTRHCQASVRSPRRASIASTRPTRRSSASALNRVRQRFPVLRLGRQYLRPHDIGGHRFVPGGGSLIGWSRILGGIETLVLVNSNGTQSRQGRVLIDANLNQAGGTMTVIANTAESAAPAGFAGPHRIGTTVPVEKDPDDATFVTIGQVGPSEVVVLTNQP